MLSFWKRAVAAILVVAGPIRQHQILLQRAKEKRPVVDRPEYLGGRKYEKQQPAHFGSKSLLSGWAVGLPADYELLPLTPPPRANNQRPAPCSSLSVGCTTFLHVQLKCWLLFQNPDIVKIGLT